MMIHIASAIHTFSQGAQEDGTVAGEGLTAIETFDPLSENITLSYTIGYVFS
jgi:hypothetical protein